MYVCTYVNTTHSIAITLASEFTVNNEGVVCVKNGLISSYTSINHTLAINIPIQLTKPQKTYTMHASQITKDGA